MFFYSNVHHNWTKITVVTIFFKIRLQIRVNQLFYRIAKTNTFAVLAHLAPNSFKNKFFQSLHQLNTLIPKHSVFLTLIGHFEVIYWSLWDRNHKKHFIDLKHTFAEEAGNCSRRAQKDSNATAQSLNLV